MLPPAAATGMRTPQRTTALTTQRSITLDHKPRVHGNGFIQLDLSPSSRLHIWGHPDIPRQDVATAVHDHRFGFRSRVLLGRMGNRRYLSRPVPEQYFAHSSLHQVYTPEVREGEDTVLVPTGQKVLLGPISFDFARTGEHYTMNAGDIHESVPFGLTVTLIEKKELLNISPRVFVPGGMRPDNSFNRYNVPEDVLWRIIAETMSKAEINL
jgi:hypothetical protein